MPLLPLPCYMRLTHANLPQFAIIFQRTQCIKISRKIAAVVISSLLSSGAVAVAVVNLRLSLWTDALEAVKSWQIPMLIRCKWKLRCLWPGIKSHLSYLVRAALKPKPESRAAVSQKQRLLMKWLFQNGAPPTTSPLPLLTNKMKVPRRTKILMKCSLSVCLCVCQPDI